MDGRTDGRTDGRKDGKPTTMSLRFFRKGGGQQVVPDKKNCMET